MKCFKQACVATVLQISKMRGTANILLSVRTDSTCSGNIRVVNAHSCMYFPQVCKFCFLQRFRGL